MPIELTTATAGQLSSIRGALETPSLTNFNALSGNVSRADFPFENGRFLIREFEIKGPDQNLNIGPGDPRFSLSPSIYTKFRSVTGRYVFTGHFKQTLTKSSSYQSYVTTPIYVNIDTTSNGNQVYCTYRNTGYRTRPASIFPWGYITSTSWTIQEYASINSAQTTGAGSYWTTYANGLAPELFLIADANDLSTSLALSADQKGVNYYPIQPPLSGWYVVSNSLAFESYQTVITVALTGTNIKPVLSSYNYY